MDVSISTRAPLANRLLDGGSGHARRRVPRADAGRVVILILAGALILGLWPPRPPLRFWWYGAGAIAVQSLASLLFTSGSTPEASGVITAWIDRATAGPGAPAWLVLTGIAIEGLCVAAFGWAGPLWLLWRGSKLRPGGPGFLGGKTRGAG